MEATRTLTKEQKEFCDRFYNETDIDLESELENNEEGDIDALYESLDERIGEIEVIYYSNAMEYLGENDASLQYSLGIASDMGYETKDLNSELLATLLKQENVRESIGEYRDEIERLFFTEEEEKEED